MAICILVLKIKYIWTKFKYLYHTQIKYQIPNTYTNISNTLFYHQYLNTIQSVCIAFNVSEITVTTVDSQGHNACSTSAWVNNDCKCISLCWGLKQRPFRSEHCLNVTNYTFVIVDNDIVELPLLVCLPYLMCISGCVHCECNVRIR